MKGFCQGCDSMVEIAEVGMENGEDYFLCEPARHYVSHDPDDSPEWWELALKEHGQ